jgi:uncharacterized repeat protein (TIGR01451 family)
VLNDLRVTKAVSNATPAVGEQVTYTIAVTNLGPSDVTSAEIRDVLPAGVLYVSSTASQGSYDSISGLWTLGAIPASGTETLSITAQITNVGAMANTASRQSSSPIDPNPANDSGTAGATSSLISIWRSRRRPVRQPRRLARRSRGRLR